MLGPRVLLVLDAASEWSRDALLGFTETAHELGWFVLHYHPGADLDWLSREWPADAAVLGPGPDGSWPSQARASTRVSLNHDRSADGIASVIPDEEAIADAALAHLLDRRLTNLTTFRFGDVPFAVARERRFLEAAINHGAVLHPSWWDEDADPPRWQENPTELVKWIDSLPRPCGVFACCDPWARVVARYALVAGRRMPEDLAILGVDDDRFECEVTAPPLSSVSVPWRNVGRLAADLVRQGLAGAPIDGRRIVVPPARVVARRSTDVLAVSDELVARAVAWIREHAHEHLSVPRVAGALSTTRQRLERRFRKSLGRTVTTEIRRARVEQARRLLATTDDGLIQVARRCGFTTAALLSVAFRREVGVAPGTYRRRLRGLVGVSSSGSPLP